eukprot:UN2104
MNRNRMENDRDPGIWNRNGRDDQQELVMEEEDNSQGTRVLTAYYQGTRVIEDKTAIFFHNLLLSFLNLIHVGSDLCLQANSAISHQESTVDKTHRQAWKT